MRKKNLVTKGRLVGICLLVLFVISLAPIFSIKKGVAFAEPNFKKIENIKRNTLMRMYTTKGEIVLELFDAEAPNTVANFKKYVLDGHYNGTIFHRVIKGFMIQGGGFDAQMIQKPTREGIQNEADNGIKNEIGTLAMARTSDPHSATAQFFINVSDNDFLNYKSKDTRGWGYAVFGKVIEGMEVVKKIEEVDTGNRGPHGDVPTSNILIEKIEEAK